MEHRAVRKTTKITLLSPFFTLFLIVKSVIAVAQTEEIMKGTVLAPNYGIGVNASTGRTDWLFNEEDYFQIAYPAGQTWGVVFITVGPPRQPPRPYQDLSDYDQFTVEMKGDVGGEQVEIGIKSNQQADNRSESKVPVVLSREWKKYTFHLTQFVGTNPARLYVLIEFVFSGDKNETIYFRNVRYVEHGAQPAMEM